MAGATLGSRTSGSSRVGDAGLARLANVCAAARNTCSSSRAVELPRRPWNRPGNASALFTWLGYSELPVAMIAPSGSFRAISFLSGERAGQGGVGAVSYTHLTLPTIYSV